VEIFMGGENFEEIDHTADLGIRVRGETLSELFVNAAAAMFHCITGGIPHEAEVRWCEVRIAADSVADLLREWLAELLYRHITAKVVFDAFTISLISETAVHARLRGARMSDETAAAATEIKAVTYHGLYVRRTEEGFEAQVIFDT
jgi:SHS2 domain-containing protein